MWIKTIRYNAGYIAHVVNPEAVPSKILRTEQVWCNGYSEDEQATIEGDSCMISNAKDFPRQWDKRRYVGNEVRWDGRCFVSLKNDEEE